VRLPEALSRVGQHINGHWLRRRDDGRRCLPLRLPGRLQRCVSSFPAFPALFGSVTARRKALTRRRERESLSVLRQRRLDKTNSVGKKKRNNSSAWCRYQDRLRTRIGVNKHAALSDTCRFLFYRVSFSVASGACRSGLWSGCAGSDCAENVDECVIDGAETCTNGGSCRDQVASTAAARNTCDRTRLVLRYLEVD